MFCLSRNKARRLLIVYLSLAYLRNPLGGATLIIIGETGAGCPVLSRGGVRHPGLPARRGGGHLGVPLPRPGEELVRARQRDALQGRCRHDDEMPLCFGMRVLLFKSLTSTCVLLLLHTW